MREDLCVYAGPYPECKKLNSAMLCLPPALRSKRIAHTFCEPGFQNPINAVLMAGRAVCLALKLNETPFNSFRFPLGVKISKNELFAGIWSSFEVKNRIKIGTTKQTWA